jgi:predicted porin
MHKKLMAAAVAGVLAAPVVAQAQSTVQIYGVAEWEYGRLEQGNGRPTVDYNEVTGSYLGFKGTEALGGGLSAWFQCETTMDLRAFDQTGLCSRNSALGFRGGFGNIWGGRWHTPFSRMYGIGMVGIEETGNLGFARIHGGTGSVSLVEQGGGDAGPLSRQQFRRRESCLTTYETPNMGGFMVGVAISCGNAASDGAGGAAAATSAGQNTKPRLWSTAATYNQGPLGLGIGYQKHMNVGAFNGAGPELDDRAWGAAARYTVGPVRLGMTYMDRKWETGVGASTKNRTWTIGGEWTIAGPHALHFAYGDTGDSKGNGAAVGGTTGGAEAPGADTGYKAFSLAYQYSFSKRTTAKLGWVRYDNDANSDAVRPYNTAALIGNGQALDSWSLVLKHRF